MTFDDWDAFDPVEYVNRNFDKTILGEDQKIIEHVITSLNDFTFRPILRAADIGAGPNFYPAMLLASILEKKGTIDLLEPSRPSRSYMQALLGSGDGIYRNINKLHTLQQIDTHHTWQKFDTLISKLGNKPSFDQTFIKARSTALSLPGDIYRLPPDTYDFISSFFVSESITTERPACRHAIDVVLHSVRPGGGFIIALMLGSKGYHAGENTHFPAVDLAFNDVEQMFTNYKNLTYRIFKVNSGTDRFRDGYDGMAVVIGQRLK
jgi:hypothetical protein